MVITVMPFYGSIFYAGRVSQGPAPTSLSNGRTGVGTGPEAAGPVI